MLFITAIGSAYFLLKWDKIIKTNHKSHMTQIVFIKYLIIILSLILLISLKFIRYNKFLTNYYAIKEQIAKQTNKTNELAAIITFKEQRLYETGLPQHVIPDFLISDKESEMYMLRTIRHYQWLYDKLYIVTNWAPESIILSSEEHARIQVLGRFFKNRKRKPFYIYSFKSPIMTAEIKQVQTPFIEEDRLNMFENSGFEKLRFRDGSGEDYYSRVKYQKSSKNNSIPSNELFPSTWDIIWANGYSEQAFAKIFATDKAPISGKKSLFLECSDTISFLSLNKIPSGDYLFQCDIFPLKESVLGVQFSLRDAQNNLKGFRKIKPFSLNTPFHLYHYSLTIQKEMLYPYPYFYFYFFLYDSGSVIVDNFYCTSLDSANN